MVRVPTLATLPDGEVSTLAVSALTAANKYILTSWQPTNYPGTGSIPSFGGSAEAQIRPPASVGYSLAVALATGTHDATLTTVSEADARVQAVRFLSSVAALHEANGGTWGGAENTPPLPSQPPPDFTWVDGWQSALWASMVAHGAWLIWSDFDAGQQADIEAMVAWEADRFLTWDIPYWTNAAGTIVNPGDTKAEEIAWDASLVTLATVMFPDHPHSSDWLACALLMSVAAGARAADLTTTVVNGMQLDEVLNGYNLRPDGTLENHDAVHPDYMASLSEVLWAWSGAYSIAGLPIPRAALWNAEVVYGAFQTVTFSTPTYSAPGGTIYRIETENIYYPEGSDWDPARSMNFAVADVTAMRHGLDTGLPVAAEVQAAWHLTKAIRRGTWGTNEAWSAATCVLELCAPRPSYTNAPAATLAALNTTGYTEDPTMPQPDNRRLLVHSDASTLGREVMAAVNAAAARTSLGVTTDTSVGTRIFVGGTRVYGDTGWRAITATPGAGTVAAVHVRRLNDMIYVRIGGAAALNGNIVALPTGFISSKQDVAVAFDATIIRLRTSLSGTLNLASAVTHADASYFASATFPSRDSSGAIEAWPTSLPGTAV